MVAGDERSDLLRVAQVLHHAAETAQLQAGERSARTPWRALTPGQRGRCRNLAASAIGVARKITTPTVAD